MNLSEYTIECDGMYGGTDKLEHVPCGTKMDPYDVSPTTYPPTLELLTQMAEEHTADCDRAEK